MSLRKRVILFLFVGILLFAQSVTALAAEKLQINDPRLEKAILLYVGSSTAYVHNVRTEIDASNSTVFAVACGAHHILALKGDGTVWEWAQYRLETEPILVQGSSDVIAISQGADNTVALKKDSMELE